MLLLVLVAETVVVVSGPLKAIYDWTKDKPTWVKLALLAAVTWIVLDLLAILRGGR